MRILWIILSILIFLGILGVLYVRIQECLSYHRKSEAERSLLRSKMYYRKERKVTPKQRINTEEKTKYKVKTEKKEIEDNTKIILTKEIVKSARTANGGLTKHQLEAIGVAWPLTKGAIDKKIGTEITKEQLQQFMTVKYVEKKRNK